LLLLDEAAVEQWLTGRNEETLTLQKPAPDDAIELVPPD
jgi:putative SOS response-associated peptidase YedK